MATKVITLYAEKQHEFESIKNKLLAEFRKQKLDVEFSDQAVHALGEAKTMLLVFERLYQRTASYASLTILLTEFQGTQTADIISSGGKEILFSFGAERNFAKHGETALKSLGFRSKTP